MKCGQSIHHQCHTYAFCRRYFLSFRPPETEYNLLAVQPVGAQESWKPAVENFFQNAGLSLKSDGLVRLDRYYVPGCDRLSLHGVQLVSVPQDLKQAILNVRAFLYFCTSKE